MSRNIVLDVPLTNGLKKCLLYVNDDARVKWGWWCPACTTDDFLVGGDDYATRDGARRTARAHEERRGHR